jgi:hypothetical protein
MVREVRVFGSCSRLMYLAAGPGIHGSIGRCVGHLVIRAGVVNPLPHAELISQSSGFCVKLAESLVARGLVPPELPQDELTVSNHRRVVSTGVLVLLRGLPTLRSIRLGSWWLWVWPKTSLQTK